MSNVNFSGNLGSDPESFEFENGTRKAKFRFAANDSYRDGEGKWQDRTNWFDVVCFNGLSEQVMERLKKGSAVMIEGRLQQRTYVPEGSEKKRTITELVAMHIGERLMPKSNK